MDDRLVTVFGGGGFVGRYVVEALLRDGARVRVADRHPKQAWYLKAQAELGRFTTIAADVTNARSVERAVTDADEVVNLVGAFANMQAVQATGAGNVARAATLAGVKALVHVSAIGADRASPSLYGRTKAQGEAAVLEGFPGATILRPSIIFGREDQFLNRFAGLIRALPVVPVIGASARFQPVFVGDVADAVVAALDHPEAHRGTTYELGGPRALSMIELNRWIARAIGHAPLFAPLPDAVSGMLAATTGWLPAAPITRDQWRMLRHDNVVSEAASGLSALGISATPMEAVAPEWLVLYRRHGRFGAAQA